MSDGSHERWLRHAISLAGTHVDAGDGGPFGCVIVQDGRVLGEGWNQVTSLRDPTAHAEVQAIRAACRSLGDFQLSGCDLYASCEPCPMCLGAIYWARPRAVYFAAARADAARAGFDDARIYDEIAWPHEARSIPFTQVRVSSAMDPFTRWDAKSDRVRY